MMATAMAVSRRANESSDLRSSAAARSAIARRSVLDDGLDHAGNAGHFVACALQILRGARDRHQEAQVAGGGLAPADRGDDLVIDLHFHLVDAVFVFHHLFGRFQAHVDQRIDRLVQLRLHQAAHFEHVRGNGVQLGIELAGDVFVVHVGPPWVAE
jgi:hypothetical protein